MIPLGFGLMFGSAMECVGLVRNSDFGTIRTPALLGTFGIMLAAVVPAYWPLFSGGAEYPSDCQLGKLGWPLAAACISIFCCICWYIPRYQPGSQAFIKAILAGWISVYFGGCFSFAVALRLSTPDAPAGETSFQSWGLFLLVGVIVLTKVADAGAYFMGRAIGRTKLCPQVSPGKTVEGLVGGMLAASGAGWLYFCWLGPLLYNASVHSSVLGVVVLGVLLTIAGVIGDLVESLFKREMNSKDSGNLLPGLGGLWDVTDSLLPAFVVAHLVVKAGLISGPQ